MKKCSKARPVAVFALIAASCPGQDRGTALILLDEVIARTEQNYAGYHLEVLPDEHRLRSYESLKQDLRRTAADADEARILDLLRRYVGWFADGHLFVQEYPQHDAADLAEFRRGTPTIATAGLRADLEARASALDPIEGVWYTPEHEIAVTRTAVRGSFVAVLLETRSPHWRPGQVIAELERSQRGYAAVLRTDDHSPRRREAEIEQGLLLHMAPYSWGRRSPLADHDRGVLDPIDPRAPHFRVIDQTTCALTLPSLAPRYGTALARLCAKHKEAITSRELLIVDLRGNEGGSSVAARALAPFYSDADRPASARAYRPEVLSSPDTIAYFERMQTGFFVPAWLRSLRTRLAERPGEFVPMYADGLAPAPFKPRRCHDGPDHVALLIDRGVVSAGEAFVLEAMPHSRVRTFGSNTGGMIDYQNVCMVAIGTGRHRCVLGYPVIAVSVDLPVGGYNHGGIPPDVPIDPSEPDPVTAVRLSYRAK